MYIQHELYMLNLNPHQVHRPIVQIYHDIQRWDGNFAPSTAPVVVVVWIHSKLGNELGVPPLELEARGRRGQTDIRP